MMKVKLNDTAPIAYRKRAINNITIVSNNHGEYLIKNNYAILIEKLQEKKIESERIKNVIRRVLEHKGINIQIIGTEAPKEDERKLRLYLIDEKKGIKDFLCEESLKVIMERKGFAIAFGSTSEENGEKSGIVIGWVEE